MFLSIFMGVKVGRELAQSEAVLISTENLQKGFDFFYNDQNRYPSLAEFEDKAVMLNYFSSYPPLEFLSQKCAQSYIYKRLSLKSLELSVCLPRPLGGYAGGWNSFSQAYQPQDF